MRKGISPLVATVLLVSITIVVAAIVASWANFYVRGKTQDITKQSDAEKACQFANFVQVEGYKSYSAGTMTVALKNIGQVDINMTDLLVSYNDGTIGVETITSTDKTIGIAETNIMTATLTKEPKEVLIRTTCPSVETKVFFP